MKGLERKITKTLTRNNTQSIDLTSRDSYLKLHSLCVAEDAQSLILPQFKLSFIAAPVGERQDTAALKETIYELPTVLGSVGEGQGSSPVSLSVDTPFAIVDVSCRIRDNMTTGHLFLCVSELLHCSCW